MLVIGVGGAFDSDWRVYDGANCVEFLDAQQLLVGQDGSFDRTFTELLGADDRHDVTGRITGRFISSTTATGTYTFTGPGCAGQPVAWTATLTDPYGPPSPVITSTQLEPPPPPTPAPPTPAPHPTRGVSYEVELKSWIPQRKVVDPEIPVANTPLSRPPPSGPRKICHYPALVGVDRITSYFKGDDHRGFSGGFRVDMRVLFSWSKRNGIQHFRIAKGRHVGTTHRLIRQRTPHKTYHCVEAKTAPDTVGRTHTDATGNRFEAAYAISQPLTAPAKLTPIKVLVGGGVHSDGSLTLHIQHGTFPSGGVRVSVDGKVVFTRIYNDASCVGVLGPAGAARLAAGLISVKTDVFQVPPNGQRTPPPIRSPLC